MKNTLQSKIQSGLILASLVTGQISAAAELSFQEVWNQIKSKSAAQESANLMTEVTLEEKTRAARHWLPKVYLDAKAYQTNDPGAVFFGLLEQKSLVQSDFAPSALNNPEAKALTRTALGMDLPLYEGGMKQAQVKMLEHQEKAQQLLSRQTELDQFAMVGNSYASLVATQKQMLKLEQIKTEVAKLIKGYQLGSKSNPVGYSGLLGMQSVENRLQALVNQNEGTKKSFQQMLLSLGLSDSSLQPTEKDPMKFVSKFFKADEPQASFKVDALKAESESTAEMSEMQKAKLRPRVGAFAETYAFSGGRDTANGYMAGVYLQWSLFNSADFNQDKSLRLQNLAKQKMAEANEQQEAAQRAALFEARKAILRNLELLNQTEGLMLEQSQVAAGLFRNGSINALQLVEIYNRRAELIQQQTEAELALIKVSAELITKTKFNITKAFDNSLALSLTNQSQVAEAKNENR